MKKYREEHKEEIRIARKKYRDKDINKFNETNRMYQRKRRKKYKENAELVIKYKEVLNRLKVVYTSMQFSTPENMYIFIEQMGDLLEEIE